MSKLIGKYVTKIVYKQAFKVGVMGILVSTLDIGFSTNMALPMQKRFSVFNEVYLLNHMHGILDCSCKWLVFKYSYRCKVPLFSLPLISNNDSIRKEREREPS